MTADEAGQAGGLEAIVFGLLTFVVGVLLAANAWAVVDAKMAMSAAAREATRAYVETPEGSDPMARAEAAAREAVRGHGRDPDRMELRALESGLTRCQVVRFEARYQVPAVGLPFIGGGGPGSPPPPATRRWSIPTATGCRPPPTGATAGDREP